MASSPETGGPRHVGLVVDPLAREDGGAEPDPVVEPAASSEERMQRESALPTPADGEVAAQQPEAAEDDVHPVRARLLARADAALRAREQALHLEGAEDRIGDPLDAFDRVGSYARPPAAPIARSKYPELTPNQIFVFGTLMGLCTVASLVALGMNLDGPRADVEAPKPQTAAPAAATKAPAPFSKPKRVRKKLPGPWRIADEKGKASVRIIEGQIGSDPFLKVLQNAGLSLKEAYRAHTVLKEHKNLDRCDRDDRFVALVDRASTRLLAFEYIVTAEEVYQAKEAPNGLLVAKKLDLKVERGRVEGALVIDGGFQASADRAGFDPGLDKVLGKALEGHSSIAELEPRTVLRVVAQEVTALGDFSRYAGIEAVDVRWPAEGSKPLRIYYFRGKKARGYFDANGRSPYEGGWAKPIKDAPITSRFNPRRMHPVLKKIMPHNGTDFGAPMGAPIGAASFGTVSFIGYAGASGNFVAVEHSGDIQTGYSHLSRFAEGLKVGDKVKRLQLVGYVGSTGRSTGPHLHFSVKKKGQFVDPETLNLGGMRLMPTEDRAAFAAARADYDRLLDSIPLPELPPASSAAKAVPKPTPAVDDPAIGDPELEGEEDASPAAQAPVAKPAKPAANKPTSGTPASVIYMTDEELQKLQSRSDSDEVEP